MEELLQWIKLEKSHTLGKGRLFFLYASGNLPPAKRDEYLRHCALGRVGTFEEVADAAAFLVSDRNSYMNGATVVLDGAV
jgi:NAD(P)-dependent dehydrogenase (short-subunit alcohol dehydrogenase family)